MPHSISAPSSFLLYQRLQVLLDAYCGDVSHVLLSSLTSSDASISFEYINLFGLGSASKE